ncbi:MAG: hypothetical protein AAGC86_05940 [Pseudomonadota bacterium]
MGLNSTDEILSHFIGMFDLTVEQMRLRDQYQDFTAERRQAELDELAGPIHTDIQAPLGPKSAEFDPLPLMFATEAPDLQVPPATASASAADISEPLAQPEDPAEIDILAAAGPGQEITFSVRSEGSTLSTGNGSGSGFNGGGGRFEWDLDYQGSVYSNTTQVAYLSDIDILGDGDFRSIDELIAQTEAAVDAAISLQALSGPLPDLEALRDIETVEDLADAIRDGTEISIPGAEVFTLTGEDAQGLFVNGEAADELPVWKDLLPAFHVAPEEEDSESTVEKDAPKEWDRSDPGDEIEGHTIITGGNLQVNQAQITSAWLDAPYIAVGGKAIDLAVISQVAVVSEIDSGLSAGQGPGSNVIQAAQITSQANPAAWLPAASTPGSEPTVLTIDRIEGDLVVAHFVQQMIQTIDTDQIGTETAAAATYWSLGDNQILNLADIGAFAGNYDLILIGENMISVDMLFQTHVLMDDDRLEAGPPLASQAPPSDGPAAFQDTGLARDGESHRQDDVSGPDLPALEDPAGPGSGDGSEPQAAGVSGGDNLVMNLASLKTIGEDIHADVSDSIAEILATQNTTAEALEAALLSDPLLAGLEQVRALQIEGSLIQVNIVEQVNILSDQDDILIEGPVPAGAEIIAGSNAMLNAAEVIKSGVDSVVMARTEGYSDLLLHQANLIEDPDLPSADETSEYINEAVVALMDDMPVADDIAEQVNMLVRAQDIAASDPLHTMLS